MKTKSIPAQSLALTAMTSILTTVPAENVLQLASIVPTATSVLSPTAQSSSRSPCGPGVARLSPPPAITPIPTRTIVSIAMDATAGGNLIILLSPPPNAALPLAKAQKRLLGLLCLAGSLPETLCYGACCGHSK